MGKRSADPVSGEGETTRTVYRASWIDVLVRWIEGFSGPAWAAYAGGLLVLALLNNAVFWLDGSLNAGTLDRVRLTDAVYLLFFTAFYHHLWLVARKSFGTFKSLLGKDRVDLEAMEYRLTTLPRRLGWVAIGLGLGTTAVSIGAESAAFGLAGTRTALPAVYQSVTTAFAFSAAFALILHTVRQLRLVTQLHRDATSISLFQLGPVHAMAHLTGRAATGLALFMLFNAVAESAAITELNVAFLAVIAVLAVVVFLSPLLGLRGRLRVEKARLAGETNAAIQLTVRRVHDRVNEDSYKDITELGTTLNALVVEKGLIERISTWPWEASTLRGVASSVLLPILLVVVGQLLERVL
jgi:hypothetical protein